MDDSSFSGAKSSGIFLCLHFWRTVAGYDSEETRDRMEKR